MKKTLLLIVFVSLCTLLYGQDYPVPSQYKMEAKEDYKPYEPQIRSTIDWYLAQPSAANTPKRQEAAAFLMKWLTGTPDVSINLNMDLGLGEIIKKNGDLLLPFILGWVKYSLDNDHSKDDILGYKAGLETMVAYYNSNKKSLQKDKNVEKYDKLIKKGELEEEVRKLFKK